MFAIVNKIGLNHGKVMISKLHSCMMLSKCRYLCTSVEETSLKNFKPNKLDPMEYNIMGKPINAASVQEKAEFSSVFPEVINTFLENLTDIPNLKEHYANLLKENIGKEKQDSGVLAITAYKMFANTEDIDSTNIKLASILGWCANMLMCANSIRDDIMDSSDLRYGNSCWYKRKDVGMKAINDANIMADGIHLILKCYFSKLDCYFPIAEWLHEVAVKIEIGHSLDQACLINGKPKFQMFTMPIYRDMIKYKTTYPLYLLPVTLGKYLAGNFDTKLSTQTEIVLSELGLFLNAQNDILDCYGDSAITGKRGNDIPEGKCTWLVVKALERATFAQKQILNEHYGKCEDESEEKIRNLFDELEILHEFLLYKQESFNWIGQIIDQITEDENRDFLNKIMLAAYQHLE